MESTIEQPCPICQDEGVLSMIVHSDGIPYFGEHTQLTISCDGCGWKHTDFIPSEGSKPGVWTLVIEDSSHLRARVVRGAHATVRLEELGLEVEPGSHSSGYVSNVEGVLERFKGICEMVKRDLEGDLDADPDSIVRITRIIASLQAIKSVENDSSATLTILDPAGHSQILHEDAKPRELTEDERCGLAVGPEIPIMDVDEAERVD